MRKVELEKYVSSPRITIDKILIPYWGFKCSVCKSLKGRFESSNKLLGLICAHG